MSEPIGWVVIEWNQAGGGPDLTASAYLHRTLDDAESEREDQRVATGRTQRRERYQIAEVHLIEDEETDR